MTTLEKTRLKLGFVPLLDAAPLVVAKERGFFAASGLDVELSRESSWASIRDKVAVGRLDGTHMLAPQALAMSLGLSPLKVPMVVGLALNLGGNTITLGNTLWERMQADTSDLSTAQALARVIISDLKAGHSPMTFATTYPHSSHTLELRLWLTQAGIDPDRDVRIIVVPPPQMIAHLSAGNISGYCVGEPWGSLAVRMGLGRVAATSGDIFAGRLEKVFAVTRDWAARHPETLLAVLTALIEAARWCDENRCELGEVMAQPQYLNVPVDAILAPLLGECGLPKDLITFHRHAANFPWRSQAMWVMEEFRACGQWNHDGELRAAVDSVFRPDLYRMAAARLGLPVPTADHKTEGSHSKPWTLLKATRPIEMGPDTLLGGQRFDPFAPSPDVQPTPISAVDSGEPS